METGNAIESKGEGNQGGDQSNRSEREPKHFVRVSTSKDGKWVFIDIVSRAFVHINYLRAIDRNKLAELAQASAELAPEDLGLAPENSGAGAVLGARSPQKSKRAGKANARAT